jgi:hypothetical protein
LARDAQEKNHSLSFIFSIISLEFQCLAEVITNTSLETLICSVGMEGQSVVALDGLRINRL